MSASTRSCLPALAPGAGPRTARRVRRNRAGAAGSLRTRHSAGFPSPANGAKRSTQAVLQMSGVGAACLLSNSVASTSCRGAGLRRRRRRRRRRRDNRCRRKLRPHGHWERKALDACDRDGDAARASLRGVLRQRFGEDSSQHVRRPVHPPMSFKNRFTKVEREVYLQIVPLLRQSCEISSIDSKIFSTDISAASEAAAPTELGIRNGVSSNHALTD